MGEWGVRGGAELLYDDELWYDESRDEDFEELRFERLLAKIKKVHRFAEFSALAYLYIFPLSLSPTLSRALSLGQRFNLLGH